MPTPTKSQKTTNCGWGGLFQSYFYNSFLRVFAISALLKVIHAPKTPNFRYPENNLPTKAWLATYFELPHPQLRNPKALRTRNRTQLAILMVAIRTRTRNFIIYTLSFETKVHH